MRASGSGTAQPAVSCCTRNPATVASFARMAPHRARHGNARVGRPQLAHDGVVCNAAPLPSCGSRNDPIADGTVWRGSRALLPGRLDPNGNGRRRLRDEEPEVPKRMSAFPNMSEQDYPSLRGGYASSGAAALSGGVSPYTFGIRAMAVIRARRTASPMAGPRRPCSTNGCAVTVAAAARAARR